MTLDSILAPTVGNPASASIAFSDSTGQPMLVCGNTAAMVSETRYHPHFRVVGDRSVHYGPFDCRPAAASAATPTVGCC
jgi:hypothetical protein